MIGETPNPDDEETFRKQLGVSPKDRFHSSVKVPEPFIIEEI
jgi:hypothetical protein